MVDFVHIWPNHELKKQHRVVYSVQIWTVMCTNSIPCPSIWKSSPFSYLSINSTFSPSCISRDSRLIFPIGWTVPDHMTRVSSIITMRMHPWAIRTPTRTDTEPMSIMITIKPYRCHFLEVYIYLESWSLLVDSFVGLVQGAMTWPVYLWWLHCLFCVVSVFN